MEFLIIFIGLIVTSAILMLVVLPMRQERMDRAAEETNEAINDRRRDFINVARDMAREGTIGKIRNNIDESIATLMNKEVPKSTIPLVPAGAVSFQALHDLCNTCQACIAACPQGILHAGSSMENFMMPVMDLTNGHCPPTCTRCAESCPTGAIPLISVDDKRATRIGTAIWLRKNCLNTESLAEHCKACGDVCPVGALELHNHKDYYYPIINDNICIGCGACSAACAASPKAIFIQGFAEHRRILA